MVVAFSLPIQGEDPPCFVKRFLPAELFSQYQSKRDLREKTKIAYIPRVQGHVTIKLNQEINPFIAIAIAIEVVFVTRCCALAK